MRRPTTPLAMTVDPAARTTLPVQIVQQVRQAVRTGTLRVGDRLPSTRALATELGVSRAVVEQAYDQLHAEGWVSGRQGSGTFVHDIAAAIDASTRARRPATTQSGGKRGPAPIGRHSAPPAQPPLRRLDTGTPWRDPRHDDAWRRAWRDVSVARPPRGYPPSAGIPELLEAVADHVARHRGIACTPDQVLITNGTTQALGLLLDTLPTGTMALEDPGYRAAALMVASRGWRVLDVPVDLEGIDVAALRRSRRGDVRAIYVTPAHQHPLGMTLTPARRRALLDEARRRDALVVEDDYDSEFRYDVAPLPALAQLGPDRVAFLGTTSKSVLPGLRLGWLVATADRVAEITARRERCPDHPSWPVQHAVSSMLRDGYVDRLLRSARKVYAERSRDVAERLAPFGEVAGGVAGMYTVVRLEPEEAQRAIHAAAAAGFELPSLADYCRTVPMSGIVFGFGGVSDSELSRALDAVEAGLRHG